MYEILQPAVLSGITGEATTFLNFGYWKESPGTWKEAAHALVRLLAQSARLGPEHEVLDVGFGYGDQDLIWMEEFAPKRIVGLNITASQVDAARKRVVERQLADRIDLRLGSAVAIPFAGATFDRVLALESAMHFATRERFFGEAYRVLRPGGRLALADFVLMPGMKGGAIDAVRSVVDVTVAQFPVENQYDSTAYRTRLEAVGFGEVRIESIREHVFDGLREHVLRRNVQLLRTWNPFLAQWPPLRDAYERMARLWADAYMSRYDYVIATADKPRSPRRKGAGARAR
jgi:cyclopropane fatty-acyl-phospholipid synthase-like methyltransferase